MLINFTVDPDTVAAILPKPFKPKTINGKAIAGICLIRRKQLRIKGLPAFLGLGSENNAHRIAVEWMEAGELKEGVYIPRRDTSSLFNTITGGRVFPGRHYRAKFDVRESETDYHIAFKSSDGTTISVDARVTDEFNPQSIFKDLPTASAFFKGGTLGYSPNGGKYDGLLLKTYTWQMKPLQVSHVHRAFLKIKV
jgi:hypothetical protein